MCSLLLKKLSSSQQTALFIFPYLFLFIYFLVLSQSAAVLEEGKKTFCRFFKKSQWLPPRPPGWCKYYFQAQTLWVQKSRDRLR